ncbi:MAG: aldo/keto reductase [Solobacterium sp.]|nr:aldo/keto reductase [Solobacterium sp.]
MTQTFSIIRSLHNGLKIPAIGSAPSFLCAPELGYRLFDLSLDDSERKAFADSLSSSGVPRYDCAWILHVPAEVHTYDETERWIRQSLKKLSASYADIVLLDSSDKGYNTQCWRALEDLYKAGTIFAMGTGCGTSAHLDRLLSESTISPMLTETVLYPGHPQKDMVRYAGEHNIDLLAVIPEDALSVLASKEIDILARKYSVSPLVLCLRYQADKKAIPIVPECALTPTQLAEALDFELSEQDALYLDSMKDYGKTD